MSKKPFAWYGGKQALAPLLLSLLPIHRVYCEVFGGSGALLFAKAPGELEIFNDLDSGVVNFFQVLRDPEQARALQQQLTLTPYAREEYYACLGQWEAADDPIEKARQWYVGVMQSMNSSIRNTGWSSTKDLSHNPARSWCNNIANLQACSGRLAHVQIDHRDFADVLRAYDSPDTCFYLDPPYVQEARKKGRCYHQEMTAADHQRLLACLTQVKGMVVLSGYDHPLYHDALTAWECVTLSVRCSAAVRGLDKMQQEPVSARTRTECIWMNPACMRAQRPRQQSFFSALPGIHEEVSV